MSVPCLSVPGPNKNTVLPALSNSCVYILQFCRLSPVPSESKSFSERYLVHIMPWPSKITDAFATIKVQPGIDVHQNQYHGPYCKLLNTLFPPHSDFMVAPNYLPGGTDFSSNITHRQRLVLVLEIKPPRHLESISKREAADRRMRDRLGDPSCTQRHCHIHHLTADIPQ